MKIFDFLVKIAIFRVFLLFSKRFSSCISAWIMYSSQTVMLDTNLLKKRRNALKMAILTKKSKIFIKAKLTVLKSCLLGPTCFMIFCILGDAHLQKLNFLRGLSTELIFFNFSDIVTYPRKLWNQN